jgi:Protein of unknown function (DUF4058)
MPDERGTILTCASLNVPGSCQAPAASAVAEPSAIEEDGSNGDPAVDSQLVVHLDIEPVTEGYIEIIEVRSWHRVVTAIEVLSPTNKRPAEGQRLYLQK